MTLTRYNYEEFFLLYIDGELEEEDRTSVETFVRVNPDLGEELQQLQRAVLVPDETWSLDKSLLYMEEPAPRATVYHIRMRAILAAASVILLAAAAFWLIRANQRTSLVQGDHLQVAIAPTHAPATQPTVATAPTPGPGIVMTHVRTARLPHHTVDAGPIRIPDTPQAIVVRDLRPAVQPTDTDPARPMLTVSGPMPSHALAVADNENNHPTVTSTNAVSYHTLEDTDQKNGDDKILFVRADQVMTGGVKGLFRKAGRVIKHSTSLSTENVHPDPDAE